MRETGGDARGSVPFIVSTADGPPLLVKAVGREQRDADLLFKAWRHLAFREVEDEAPFASVKQQVEHEAYLSLLAARAGVRTPAPSTAVPAGDGHVLLVRPYVAGRTLDGMSAGQVGDPLLASLWAEVRRLRATGIAHRDLRRANVLVDTEGRPWLLDFGFAEAAASPRRLARDVAELLASLAGVVGPTRAVRSAVDTLGAGAVAEALPLLQPAALAAATRAGIRPDLLAELRDRAAIAAGVDLPRIEPLTRVPARTLLLVVTTGFAIHLLLPHVGRLSQTMHALQAVRWDWIALALALSASRYVAAAAALIGAVEPTLGLRDTTLVQVAGSFVDRLMPGPVGARAGSRIERCAPAGRSDRRIPAGSGVLAPSVHKPVPGLQRHLLVTSAGVREQRSGWPAVVLDLTCQRFDVGATDPRYATTRFLDTMIDATPAQLARVYQWPTTTARAALDDQVATGLAVRTPAGYRGTAHSQDHRRHRPETQPDRNDPPAPPPARYPVQAERARAPTPAQKDARSALVERGSGPGRRKTSSGGIGMAAAPAPLVGRVDRGATRPELPPRPG